MPTSNDIRRQFIEFFTDKHEHAFVPSSPVVPHDDPTLLFANAGMNQFKPYFLGTEKPEHTRVANTQKCIRAGGKHNDLDDVGKDTYHHTFFEMLGNWSFGDYFKAEAIDWAWELLVDVWGLDPQRLHATYFEGDASEGLEPDTEARDLWLKHLPAERVHPGDKKDNFWEMGDTGPCGPCSELHYDGTEHKTGGKLINADHPNVIEIWNLVFIQFNRNADGQLAALPAKHIDTGMGFERIVRVLQNKSSNYDTDVFTPLFVAIEKVTGARAYEGDMLSEIDIAYRVIADHIRTLTFALTDGAHCGNEGRDYVLRRILRRAVRYGRQHLGVREPFFYKLVDPVVEHFGETFPELKKNPQAVADELRDEEESFRKTLDHGIELFNEETVRLIQDARQQWAKVIRPLQEMRESALTFGEQFKVELNAITDGLNKAKEIVKPFIEDVQKQAEAHAKTTARIRATIEKLAENSERLKSFMDDLRSAGVSDSTIDVIMQMPAGMRTLPGELVFQLHSTHGLYVDILEQMAEERGFRIDYEGFQQRMAEHQQRSRVGGGGGSARDSLVEFVQRGNLWATQFVGYESTIAEDTRSTEVLVKTNGHYRVEHLLDVGQSAAIVVDKSPFYAESGGQVGDTGTISSQRGAVFRVDDTIRIGEVQFHLGELESGNIRRDEPAFSDDDPLLLQIDTERREKIMAHHSTTHLMNWALRKVLGDHIQQAGSLVDDEKTRFDFTHAKALTPDEIEQVETLVNQQIQADHTVYADVAPQEDALKIKGLRAVFGEKYPPQVRIVSIGVPVKDLLKKPDNDEWMNYSIEFCGGTHLGQTAAASHFVIVEESSVAKGVRRLIAVAGGLAEQAESDAAVLTERLEAIKQEKPDSLEQDLAAVSEAMGDNVLPLRARNALRDLMSDLQKVVKKHRKAQSKQAEGDVIEAARKIADEAEGELVIAAVDGADANTLRKAMDVIRKKKPDAAMMLAAPGDDKVAFLAAVPDALIERGLKAGDWVREVAKVAEGGGGGRADMAQAGGKNPAKLADALNTARTFAAEKLG